MIWGSWIRFEFIIAITQTKKVIFTSVADPDPGSGAFLAPGSGMNKKSGSRSGV
jgi:hypothetical protein